MRPLIALAVLTLIFSQAAAQDVVTDVSTYVKAWEGKSKHPINGCADIELLINRADGRRVTGKVSVSGMGGMGALLSPLEDPIDGRVEPDGTLAFIRYDPQRNPVTYRLKPSGEYLVGRATGFRDSEVQLVAKGSGAPITVCD